MTKIDIFSGFLGAGKTTLIKKLIAEGYKGEKLVLIENEFGEIGIDGGFMKNSGVQVNEMNSGCICCSLAGDFSASLKEVLERFEPDRILIEPSGVGKLSDVMRAVKDAEVELELCGCTAVVDAKKCKMYMKNFGEFFNNQIENATSIILSHTASLSQDKIDAVITLVREHNKDAVIVTTDWDDISGEKILDAIYQKNSLKTELSHLEHEHHHHHHDDDCDCGCHDHEHEHHHHHHDDDCDCGCHDHEHEHHHHHHDDDCDCGCHDHEHEHHHHHHDDDCDCGCHDHEHEHHHHHHADEIFTSFGKETAKKFTAKEIETALSALQDEEKYGVILRAKGIVAADNEWIYFDYVPGEVSIRYGKADVTGKLC
ncbi:MAG: GTP-binding protein, partial [Acutalibacteraceae bacterium]|nr:GTP-binding protein [Acutalibacteraceae bacterium]